MPVLWIKGGMPKLPELTPERLQELRDKIKPVVCDPENEHGVRVPHEIEPVGHNTAFTWSPVKTHALKSWRQVAFIETYHSCGYIACFKPLVDEVLCQIPEHLVAEVTHFELVTGDTVGCLQDGDGHRTMAILYQDLSHEDA